MKVETLCTSITLPVWQRGRYRTFIRSSRYSIPAQLAPLLAQKARNLKKAQRLSTKEYNEANAAFVKVSVRWPVDFYNRIHFLSYHLRISVSLLMHAFLLLWYTLPALNKKANGKFVGVSYLTVTRKFHGSMISFKEMITFNNGGQLPYS